MKDARGRGSNTTRWAPAVYRSAFHLAILLDRRFGLDAPVAWIGIDTQAIKALRSLGLCNGQSNSSTGVIERPI